MGMLILVLLLTSETVFLVWSLLARNNRREEKGIVHISGEMDH